MGELCLTAVLVEETFTTPRTSPVVELRSFRKPCCRCKVFGTECCKVKRCSMSLVACLRSLGLLREKSDNQSETGMIALKNISSFWKAGQAGCFRLAVVHLKFNY